LISDNTTVLGSAFVVSEFLITRQIVLPINYLGSVELDFLKMKIARPSNFTRSSYFQSLLSKIMNFLIRPFYADIHRHQLHREHTAHLK